MAESCQLPAHTHCRFFAHANLLNCVFQGANLEEAVFDDTQIDKSTNFCRASLVNAYYDDDYDNAGNLLSHGVDLKQANHAETTKFGKDPPAFPSDVDQRALEIAHRDYGPEGRRILHSSSA